MVWGESDSMPPQVSSKRRIATNFQEFIAIPKIMKVKVEVSPKKDGDKKQITGLVTTRRIATKILEFIAITKKL